MIKRECELSEDDKIPLVDDKPSPVNEVADLEDIITVKVSLRSLKLAWAGSAIPDLELKQLTN